MILKTNRIKTLLLVCFLISFTSGYALIQDNDTVLFQHRSKSKVFNLSVNNFHRVDEVKIKNFGWYQVVIGELEDSSLTLYFQDTALSKTQQDSLEKRFRKSPDSLNLILFTIAVRIPIDQIQYIAITNLSAGKRKLLNGILSASLFSPPILWIAGVNPVLSLIPIGVAYTIHLKINHKNLDLENKWQIIPK